jgi:hypothetical protein
MTMSLVYRFTRPSVRRAAGHFVKVSLAAGLVSAAACSSTPKTSQSATPKADPRVGLKAGLWDAQQSQWNLKVVSETRPPEKFVGSTNSDLAFSGKYAIQGNYNGFQVWDISNPSKPVLTTAYFCPASQSDVSVYKNLLFVSGEGNGGRLDCGGEGVKEQVSKDRLRGIRIFDITDITNPKYIANVQTCRGSHTHTVVEDPRDKDNVYVYVSGQAGVRSAEELQGCTDSGQDQNSSRFRIEVIQVPLANPAAAKIVNGARIFENLTMPHSHGAAPADIAEINAAKARGDFIADIGGQQMVLPPQFTKPMLDSIVKARNGTGNPTGADSAALRAAIPGMVAKMMGASGPTNGPRPGPDQCHDITVYPAIGLAGGACGGYGLLLDIKNPANPVRIDAAADTNFSYWHSATFNNDGTKLLFSDEWGGGGAPKCRATDKPEWGADAIFTLDASKKMNFQSYYKMPAPQTPLENCVAHNGSLIPIPGRDVMVQAWYQGGLSVFDWTDARHPTEIGFFDRGPSDSTRMALGGSWSVYWYNGVIVSSEIQRGLDILELTPSPMLTQNEIDAAKTVHLEYLNAQGQPQFVWPATFALARAYVDQLERSGALTGDRLASVRRALSLSESSNVAGRSDGLSKLATQLEGDGRGTKDEAKFRMLVTTVRELAK